MYHGGFLGPPQLQVTRCPKKLLLSRYKLDPKYRLLLSNYTSVEKQVRLVEKHFDKKQVLFQPPRHLQHDMWGYVAKNNLILSQY